MVNAYTRGAVEVLYAGAVEVRSWCGRGTLVVRSRYARGAVEVRSWYGPGTVEVRSWCASGSVRLVNFSTGDTVLTIPPRHVAPMRGEEAELSAKGMFVVTYHTTKACGPPIALPMEQCSLQMRN